MKIYLEGKRKSVTIEGGFVILTIGEKEIQITEDDKKFEIYTNPNNCKLSIEPLTQNKIYVDVIGRTAKDEDK